MRGDLGDRSLRILHLTDFYPPLLGGLELQVQGLAGALAHRGHRVSVATLTGPAREEDDQHGVRVHRITGWSHLLAPLYEQRALPFHPTAPDPGVVAALRRIIALESPDIVHAHSWILHSFLPLKAKNGPRLIVSLHDYGLVCPKRTFIYRDGTCSGPALLKCLACSSEHYGPLKGVGLTTGLWAMQPLYRRVDRFVANSRATAAATRHLRKVPRARVEIVPPFLRDEDAAVIRHPGPAPRPLLYDDGFILFAGGFGPHKGVDVLLEAYRGLAEAPPLLLVGVSRTDTPRQLPVGVTAIQNMPHPQLLGLWSRCLFAVVPSIWPEPFGVVALEAMAAGKPVVASATGGLVDVVTDGKTGVLVPPGDPITLRQAMDGLIRNPQVRAQMGLSARNAAQRFCESEVVGRFERIYRDALSRV